MDEDDYEERPKTTRKKRKSKSGDESDDEFVGREAKKAKGLAAISEGERDRLASEIARYLLFSESTKSLTSRQDISKAVLSQQNAGSLLTPLLPFATEKLKEVFGWDLVAVPSFTPKGKFNEVGKTHMLLRMTPELQEFMAPVRKELAHDPNQVFLMIVLSLILMHNFAIDEELLLANLAKFGFKEEAPLTQFGDKTVSDMLKTLAKQHYISIAKSKDGGNATHQVNIGSRSLLEIGKVNILRFINSICKSSIDPSALREFTNEQIDFLPRMAAGEEPLEPKEAQPQQDEEVELVEEVEEAPNGHAPEEVNGRDEEEEEAPARRGAKATRAKKSAANGTTPASPPARRPRRKN